MKGADYRYKANKQQKDPRLQIQGPTSLHTGTWLQLQNTEGSFVAEGG